MEGPFWLDAASALLGLPLPVDMVAETRVQLRRVPIAEFRQSLAAMPEGARGLLLDMASGYRQQSELAVSRLAHDAETRCAQWLLNHAQQDASGTMRVTLHQRKRLIAAQLGIAPETILERTVLVGAGIGIAVQASADIINRYDGQHDSVWQF